MRTIRFDKNIPQAIFVQGIQKIWPDVVYSNLSPTRLREIQDPPLPGPKWVRVQNRLCGICASDLHLLLLEVDPKVAPAAFKGQKKFFPGHEVLGIITETGEGVTGLKKGDRVVMDSRAVMKPTCFSRELDEVCTHCQEGNFQLCENAYPEAGDKGIGGGWGDSFIAHETELYKVPDDIDDESAMMIEPLSVGVRSALKRLPKPTEKVLVIGSGIVGLDVIQAVKALSPDCDLTAIARYPHQERMAKQFGANHIITAKDPYVDIAKLINGTLYEGMFNNKMITGGFDVIFDCVGSARSVTDSLRWARAGGTVVLVGVSLEQLKIDLSPVWYQEVDLIGTLAHGMEQVNGTKKSTYDLTCEMLIQGKLTTEGLITHYFKLDDWKKAVKTSLDKRKGVIKVVLDYR